MSVVRFPGGNRVAAEPQESKALLTFTDVQKRFVQPDGAVNTAIDGVSLDIAEREFVALIGPSGCGKTTVLRLANGLITPDGGAIRIDGQPPKPGPDMGFVFQAFRLIPWASAQANIEFALESLELSKAERAERARHYLDLVGVVAVGQSVPGPAFGRHEAARGVGARAGRGTPRAPDGRALREPRRPDARG